MKTSSLAERLQEYEAACDSLNLTREPRTRIVVPQESPATPEHARRPVRRAFRARTIEIRDQGLRLFRVS
jgi:hypothetical protein